MKEVKFTSFEAACAQLNISTALPDVSMLAEKYGKALVAHHKLMVLVEANNGDWVVDYKDDNQRKYFPWFEYVPGSGWVLDDCGLEYTGAYVGARLALKSAELAKEMGREFIGLYSDLLSGQK
ncbi:hypothetical protein CJD36_019995 [Flavipsychrobacter stenotrophus]|uniref:Uncharacterized protein n=1 Tax=Flavipsychrobacter stenotrophus TaxID=2077091 RepID=A0A2S7SRH9_9BACT|nr:hypothetical protein [Flavipsychrobacter stenotrophus]PQJ09522.1 hypothetical protein CJD36_019995 [Flavipsychrobacter stenotrophus]